MNFHLSLKQTLDASVPPVPIAGKQVNHENKNEYLLLCFRFGMHQELTLCCSKYHSEKKKRSRMSSRVTHDPSTEEFFCAA